MYKRQAVNFKTDSTANVNYALVASNEIPSQLKKDFEDMMANPDDPEWEAYKKTVDSETDMTVLWALLTQYTDGYTVFDKLANASNRNTVHEFVSGISSMGVDVAKRGSVELNQANGNSAEQDFASSMKGATYYYCLATAVSPLGSEMSFAAVAGIHIRDSEPPKLLSVNTDARSSGGGLYSGTVTFVFDEPVYQLVTQNGVDQKPMQIWQTQYSIGTDDQGKAVNFPSIIGSSRPDNFFCETNIRVPSTTLTLSFKDIPLATTLVLFTNSYICDENSNSTREILSFTLQSGVPIGNIPNGTGFVQQ